MSLCSICLPGSTRSFFSLLPHRPFISPSHETYRLTVTRYHTTMNNFWLCEKLMYCSFTERICLRFMCFGGISQILQHDLSKAYKHPNFFSLTPPLPSPLERRPTRRGFFFRLSLFLPFHKDPLLSFFLLFPTLRTLSSFLLSFPFFSHLFPNFADWCKILSTGSV